MPKIEAAAYQQVPWFEKTGNPEMIQAIFCVALPLWPKSVSVFAKRRAIENVMSASGNFESTVRRYDCTDWTRKMAAWRNVAQRFRRIDTSEIDV